MIQNIITAMKYKLRHVFKFEVFYLEIFGNIVHPWIQASWLQVLAVNQLQPNQNSTVLHEPMLFLCPQQHWHQGGGCQQRL